MKTKLLGKNKKTDNYRGGGYGMAVITYVKILEKF